MIWGKGLAGDEFTQVTGYPPAYGSVGVFSFVGAQVDGGGVALLSAGALRGHHQANSEGSGHASARQGGF